MTPDTEIEDTADIKNTFSNDSSNLRRFFLWISATFVNVELIEFVATKKIKHFLEYISFEVEVGIGGKLFMSYLSFCHSVIQSESLAFFVTFCQ